jgi:isopentenyl diphosphate isomerase/L-lactate dehydrogenase-like FMN-dependent dehydrogenase
MTGRPYLYGLGAAGEAGVDRACDFLTSELERTMALIGCASVSKLDGSVIRRTIEHRA